MPGLSERVREEVWCACDLPALGLPWAQEVGVWAWIPNRAKFHLLPLFNLTSTDAIVIRRGCGLRALS